MAAPKTGDMSSHEIAIARSTDGAHYKEIGSGKQPKASAKDDGPTNNQCPECGAALSDAWAGETDGEYTYAQEVEADED